MAISTRTMFQGDSWPALKLEASDDTGVLNLSTASVLTVECVGTHGNIIKTAAAIQPAEADPDGIHHWNATATLSTTDTAVIDDYRVYLKVQWDAGATEIQTFGPDTLSVIAKPV